MFALLYRNEANNTEVFHMTQFLHITNRWLPLYLANDTDANTNGNEKILEQYLANHVNDIWKKYL
jgi:5-methylthioribose kinase